MVEERKQEQADVIVIGAGPGGMTAAQYASRANLNTILIEKGAPGGEVINTADVENYPGFTKISGPELAGKIYESSMAFGANHVYGDVTQVEVIDELKYVHTADTTYIAPAVIVATGSHHRTLNIPGEESLSGRGVSYCAVCDGFFFRDKDVIVVGGGDSAVEEGTYLTQFAKSVQIIHRRDTLRAQQILQERAFANEKISFIWDSVVESINGDEHVTSVSVRNLHTNELTQLEADGVFIYIGLDANNQAVASLPILDEEGWIITNDRMETTIPGIFAVGDVRSKHLRQIATAVGDGSIAGHQVYEYLQNI